MKANIFAKKFFAIKYLRNLPLTENLLLFFLLNYLNYYLSHFRSLKSGQGRKSRSGKSQSPRRATTGATADEPLVKIRRTSMSRTRTNQKLPPLPQVAKRSFTGNRSMPTPGKSMEHKLPPTAVTK